METVCDRASVDPDAILYQPACLKITYGTGEKRILHGMVRSFAATGQPVRDRFAYTLTVVPRLWFMGQTTDCRIFSNKTIADIITTICGETGQTIDIKIYGEMMPVFPIPAEQTKSGFRSRSSEQGGTSSFSELSFDDNKGQEKVYLHAEKDMKVEVEHDQTIIVDHDRSLTVKHQETIKIDDSQTVSVANGRTTTIKAAGDNLTVENGGITVTAKQSDIAV